jgi:hypothetical protein
MVPCGRHTEHRVAILDIVSSQKLGCELRHVVEVRLATGFHQLAIKQKWQLADDLQVIQFARTLKRVLRRA